MLSQRDAERHQRHTAVHSDFAYLQLGYHLRLADVALGRQCVMCTPHAGVLHVLHDELLTHTTSPVCNGSYVGMSLILTSSSAHSPPSWLQHMPFGGADFNCVLTVLCPLWRKRGSLTSRWEACTWLTILNTSHAMAQRTSAV